jgi:hypothetical protein
LNKDSRPRTFWSEASPGKIRCARPISRPSAAADLMGWGPRAGNHNPAPSETRGPPTTARASHDATKPRRTSGQAPRAESDRGDGSERKLTEHVHVSSRWMRCVNFRLAIGSGRFGLSAGFSLRPPYRTRPQPWVSRKFLACSATCMARTGRHSWAVHECGSVLLGGEANRYKRRCLACTEGPAWRWNGRFQSSSPTRPRAT